jgi:hypothetical protein
VLAAMACLGSHLGALLPREWWTKERWKLAIVGAVTILAIPLSAVAGFQEVIPGAELWFILSVIRLSMQCVFLRIIFRWLVRKISRRDEHVLPLA